MLFNIYFEKFNSFSKVIHNFHYLLILQTKWTTHLFLKLLLPQAVIVSE